MWSCWQLSNPQPPPTPHPPPPPHPTPPPALWETDWCIEGFRNCLNNFVWQFPFFVCRHDERPNQCGKSLVVPGNQIPVDDVVMLAHLDVELRQTFDDEMSSLYIQRWASIRTHHREALALEGPLSTISEWPCRIGHRPSKTLCVMFTVIRPTDTTRSTLRVVLSCRISWRTGTDTFTPPLITSPSYPTPKPLTPWKVWID